MKVCRKAGSNKITTLMKGTEEKCAAFSYGKRVGLDGWERARLSSLGRGSTAPSLRCSAMSGATFPTRCLSSQAHCMTKQISIWVNLGDAAAFTMYAGTLKVLRSATIKKCI